jgi:hypothetical protein
MESTLVPLLMVPYMPLHSLFWPYFIKNTLPSLGRIRRHCNMNAPVTRRVFHGDAGEACRKPQELPPWGNDPHRLAACSSLSLLVDFAAVG